METLDEWCGNIFNTTITTATTTTTTQTQRVFRRDCHSLLTHTHTHTYAHTCMCMKMLHMHVCESIWPTTTTTTTVKANAPALQAVAVAVAVVCCCLCPLLGGIPCFGNIMENQFVFGASTGRMSIYLVRVACNQRVADHNIYIESNRF